ncbi:hypothetical protein [Streptomyces sp. NPDC000134]
MTASLAAKAGSRPHFTAVRTDRKFPRRAWADEAIEAKVTVTSLGQGVAV